MLHINNLNAAVDDGQKQILNGLSLDVPAGEVHAIMGPRAQEECHVLLLETVGTKNNGTADVDAIYDAPVGEWI